MWAMPSWLHHCTTSQQLYNSNIIWSSLSIYYHRLSKSLTSFSCQRKHRHNHILCYTSVFLSFLWSSFKVCEFGRCESVLDLETHASLLQNCTILSVMLQGSHSLDCSWAWLRTQVLISFLCLWSEVKSLSIFVLEGERDAQWCDVADPGLLGMVMVQVGQVILGIMTTGWMVRQWVWLLG